MIVKQFWAGLMGAALCLGGCTPHVEEAAATEHPASAGNVILSAWRGQLDIEKIAPKPRPEALRAHGKVVFDGDHTQFVTAPVSGRITKLQGRVGDTAIIGRALGELVSADVAQMQVERRRAHEDLGIAKQELQRMLSLHEHGAVSEKELAQAQAELKKAQAEDDRAAAALAHLNIAEADAPGGVKLLARVGGTVVERAAYVGQEVRADQDAPLFVLSDLRSVWLMADVYESDVDNVVVGSQATFSVATGANQSLNAKVAYVADVVDPQSRTVKVRLVADNAHKQLKPNMHVQVSFALAANDAAQPALYVPARSVLRDNGLPYVLRVDAQDRVERRRVRLGREVAGQQRVLEGLDAGDAIVSRGAIFLDKALRQ